ncbi:MAG: metallophosphoesterase [Anaerolineae bacterium]|nr:metallophosphoesterase [Anaerolineae bacterium]
MTGQKLKFVLSDLHLGAGYARESQNRRKGFTADRELCDFLHTIWRESEREQREIELIINGDFFEFLQVPAVEVYEPLKHYPLEAYLDSSQAASIKRLNIIAEGHPEVFNALSDFMHVEQPQRRITLIKGNHDVNLFWPGVKSRLREILGASGTRASLLLFADEFVSREKIYVEHGHQRAEKMNRYPDFFDPRSPDNPTQLHYPVGSRLVINAGHKLENEYWFVDHIKPITTLIWYALPWDFDFAGKMLAHYIRHTVSTEDDLLQDLEDDEKRGAMARRYANDPTFRQQFHQQLQPYLRLTDEDNREVASSPQLVVGDNALAIGQADRQRQQAMLHHAATEIVKREGARVVLFGHTHYPVQEFLNNDSVYINTGSWIEDFSDASPETWAALFSGSWQSHHAAARLPYARIDYNEHHLPTAQLLFFEQKAEAETQNFFQQKFSWLVRIFGNRSL